MTHVDRHSGPGRAVSPLIPPSPMASPKKSTKISRALSTASPVDQGNDDMAMEVFANKETINGKKKKKPNNFEEIGGVSMENITLAKVFSMRKKKEQNRKDAEFAEPTDSMDASSEDM